MEDNPRLKVFRITNANDSTIKFVYADYMMPTACGIVLMIQSRELFENDKVIYAVPVGCGVEEIPQKEEKVTVAHLVNAYRKGRIAIR